MLLNELYGILLSGSYFFIDFGRFFFFLDQIDSHLAFCVDTLALVCAILVVVLTNLALYFGVEYMSREAFINRLLYLLNFFAASVVFLFFCYDFFLIILIWECIGLFSLLLVNFYSMRVYTIKAALKTFVFSRISDMFMFLSFILAVLMFNTTDLSLIFLQIPFYLFHYLFVGNLALHFLTFFSFCLVTSGVIKAAQFFFHVWLPDAMEAPTPASALIHSSTLVVAGVFLILRFALLFEFTIFTNYFLAILGGVTLAMAAVTATFQHDIKKLVAYSTISQIGYLVCGCGFCCYEEVLLYLIIHALNKAFLFILVGYLVHFFNGNTDMRNMGGAYLYSFDITIFVLGVAINLAGLPYSAGFFGKEFLLFQILKDDFLSYLVRACWLISFFFTPVYMFILLFFVVFGVKKSNLGTYRTFWFFAPLEDLFVLTSTGLRAKILPKTSGSRDLIKLKLGGYLTHRFQFTAITSRSTVYLFFFFCFFFFFFGEFLVLLLINFTNLSDSLPANSFFSLKSHFVFDLQSYSFLLTKNLLSLIVFFSFAAVFYLLGLKWSFTYFYLSWSFYIDFFFFIVVLATYMSPVVCLVCALVVFVLKRTARKQL